MKFSRSFYFQLKNPNGQGVLEYIIISCLVGICCLVAVKQFGQVLEKRIDYMKRQITANIEMN